MERIIEQAYFTEGQLRLIFERIQELPDDGDWGRCKNDLLDLYYEVFKYRNLMFKFSEPKIVNNTVRKGRT